MGLVVSGRNAFGRLGGFDISELRNREKGAGVDRNTGAWVSLNYIEILCILGQYLESSHLQVCFEERDLREALNHTRLSNR